MFRIAVAVLAGILAAGSAAIAQPALPEPDAATQATILALREQAWRSWFSNDREGFLRVVPDELVALGWGGGPWQDREQSLESMAQFAAGGGSLKSLEFPRNVFQQYGDTVILYTSFRAVLVDRDGLAQPVAGRGTEVFVRRDGRWIHTGWHLDPVAETPPAATQ